MTLSLLRRRAAVFALCAAALAVAAPAARADTDNPSGVADDQAASFLGQLQTAMKTDDAPGVAELIAYPLIVNQGGKHRRVPNAAAFIKAYATIVTPAVKQAVLGQTPAKLFHNGQGVMIGDGQVWFGAVCDDKACQSQHIRLISFNL